MTTRQDDNFVKISREVPLWSIVCALTAIVIQAGALYYGQLDQAKTQTAQSRTLETLLTQINQLSVEVAKLNVNNVRNELRSDDHQRRIEALERMAERRVKNDH